MRFEVVLLQKSQVVKFEEAFKKKKFGHNHTKFQCWLRLKFASVGTESQTIYHLASSKLASNVPKRKVKRIQNVPVGSARYDITSDDWKKILADKKVVEKTKKNAPQIMPKIKASKKVPKKTAPEKVTKKKALEKVTRHKTPEKVTNSAV